jgi:heme exporter protein CcmD
MGKGDYTFFIASSYAVTFILLMMLIVRAVCMYRRVQKQITKIDSVNTVILGDTRT